MPPSSSAKTEEFWKLLRDQWKYSDYSRNLEFYNTASLRKWMTSSDQAAGSKPNAELLLAEVHDAIQTNFPGPICTGDSCYVLVFSILLVQRSQRLIHLFQKAQITDRCIDDANCNFSKLKATLKSHNASSDDKIDRVEKVISDFDHHRWEFCPVVLDLEKGRFLTPELIFPFCDSESASSKGGTAAVVRVAVPAVFISDRMKKRLTSNFWDPINRECYQLAVKSYRRGNKSSYEREIEAFRGLDHQPGIIRCLGYYEMEFRGYSFHIILEVSKMDLAVYLRDHTPPEFPTEIVEFWKTLFPIAQTIATVHNLWYPGPHEGEFYRGWHGDVKPDNILLVHGKWKLADFGFTTFRPANSQEERPTAYLAGGTQTFGAPEMILSSESEVGLARRPSRSSPVEQTADVWSFGCVLSVAATWIMASADRIDDYSVLRSQACHPERVDAFHRDGKVLPEIKQWHQYLKSVRRMSDFVSSDVLDMVEENMLTRDRLSSADLCNKFLTIIQAAESKLHDGDFLTNMETSFQKVLEARKNSHNLDQSQSRSPEQSRGTNEAPTGSVGSRSHQKGDEQTDVPSSQQPAPYTASPPHSGYRSPSGLEASTLDSSVDPTSAPVRVLTQPNASLPLSPPASLVSRKSRDASSLGSTGGTGGSRDDVHPAGSSIVVGDVFAAIKNRSISLCRSLSNDHPLVGQEFNNDCHTPIMCAVINGDSKLVEVFLPVSDLTQADSGGRTVVHLAIIKIKNCGTELKENQALDTLKMILTSCTLAEQLVNKVDADGASALFYCVQQGQSRDVLLKTAALLIECKAKINSPETVDGLFKDVLIEAVGREDFGMIRLLLQHEAVYDKARGPKYKTIDKRIRKLLEIRTRGV